MYKSILYLIVILTITSCNSDKKTTNKIDNEKEYFEGSITYSIDYVPTSADFETSYLESNIGDNIILIFKNGNYKKEYYSSNGDIVSTRYLDLKRNKSYTTMVKFDSVFWIDITKEDTKTNFTKLKSSIILNEQVEVYNLENFVSYENSKIEKVISTCSYAKNILINPEWYSNYFEGNYNEIVKESPGISLQQINHQKSWKQTITATEIVYRKVNDSEIKFENTNNFPLIEL